MTINPSHTEPSHARRQALIDAVNALAKRAIAEDDQSAGAILLTLAGTMIIGTTYDLHRLTHNFAQDQILLIDANR